MKRFIKKLLYRYKTDSNSYIDYLKRGGQK